MKRAEYRAKREWLRSHPQGLQAQIVRRELRAHERELEDRAISLEAWLESDQARLGLSPWYVAFFHNRPGQPLPSKVATGIATASTSATSGTRISARRTKPK